MLCTNDLKVDDAESARRFIEKYDDLVSRGIVPHRVAQKFCGTVAGNLRSDMELLANTGQWTVRLRTEVTAYQCCILDDAFMEGPHSGTSKETVRAPASLPSFWSATSRMKQNISLKQTFDKLKPGFFAKKFQYWRSVLKVQKTSTSLRRNRHWHVRGSVCNDFIKKVYRMDEYGTSPLKSIKTTQKAFNALVGGEDDVATPGTMVRVLKQFLQGSLDNGHVYSAPRSNVAALTSDNVSFFQVVDTNANRYKRVRTASSIDVKLLDIPALLQPLSVYRDTGEVIGDDLLLFNDGDAVFRDVMTLAGPETNANDLFKTLTSWTLDAVCDVGGCMRIHTPQKLCDRQWTTYLVLISMGCVYMYIYKPT